ncbi:MAG: DUF4115 domain-containing protein, partial [Leptolyngbyaceae bacterium]|nr:DUF4115 domain-containing protein [Leptolyngbyaceae bacterium]
SRSTPTVISNVDIYQLPTKQSGTTKNILSGSKLGSNPAVPNAATNSPLISTEGLANILPLLNQLTTPEQSVRVSVIFKAQSWLRVVADGKTEFEGVLPEGTQRTWAAKQQLTLRAGNAGGVLVAVNNGQAKQLGNPGSVEEVTFGNTPQASIPASPLLTAQRLSQ